MWRKFIDNWKKNFKNQFGERKGWELFFFILQLEVWVIAFTVLLLIFIECVCFTSTILIKYHFLPENIVRSASLLICLTSSIAFYVFAVATTAGNNFFLKITNAMEKFLIGLLFPAPSKSPFLEQKFKFTISFQSSTLATPYTPPRAHHP
jgi:hypothetical protein